MISIDVFKGMIPRIAAELLPNPNAQNAVNCSLLDGEIELLNGPSTVTTLAGGPFQSIFWLNRTTWIAWNAIVDVVLSSILGDTSGTFFFTGTDVPRVSNTSLAGSGPSPTTSYKLGAPAPLNAPSADYDYTQLVPASLDPANSTTLANYQYTSGSSLSTASIVNAGTGYKVGDLVTLAGGTSTRPTILKVTTVSSGTVTGLAAYDAGSYSVVPSNPIAQASTTGAGTGLTLNGTFVAGLNVSVVSSFFQIEQNGTPLNPAYLFRDFGFGLPLSSFQTDFNLDATHPATKWSVFVGVDKSGLGNTLNMQVVGTTLFITAGIGQGFSQSPTQDPRSAGVSPSATIALGTTYTLLALYVGETTLGSKYVVRVKNGSTILINQVFYFTSPPVGSNCGFNVSYTAVDQKLNVTNIGSQSFIADGASISSEYVYTYVAKAGNQTFESAPSPASVAIIDDANGTLKRIITFPATPATTPVNEQTTYGSTFAADYNIVGKRLYRTLTSSVGSTFNLVADESVLTNATTTYTDLIPDSALQDELPSDGWVLPPTDGHDILALPNGIYAMASGNQLCLSPVGQPHTYPISQRLPSDTKIVALAALDTTVVVLTQGFPYLAFGNDPTAFTMSKQERSYGCVSKQSVAYVRRLGVVYAAPDGLIAIAGAGPVNLTEGYFIGEDGVNTWPTYMSPANIVATARDDRYFGFTTVGGTVKGFIFDHKETGQQFSWVDLSPLLNFAQNKATGYFTDSVTGDLYMIRDGTTVEKFGAGAVLQYIWRSKLFRQPFPMSVVMGRAKPRTGYNSGTTPITSNLIVDGTLVTTTTIQDRKPFMVPAVAGEDFEIELSGKWPLEQIDYAPTPEGLK